MNNSMIVGFVVAIIMTALLSFPTSIADGHPHSGTTQTDSHMHEPQTEVIPIDGKIGIEKTVILMHAPADNTLPWGFVEGKIANPASDYPVIIQIYDDQAEATHFAQTNVEADGTYEYQFRVRNVNNGEVIHIFEGDYYVKIFKVVYLHTNSNQV